MIFTLLDFHRVAAGTRPFRESIKRDCIRGNSVGNQL
jgi:hypothetical protein